LQSSQGYSEDAACTKVASEFPDICLCDSFSCVDTSPPTSRPTAAPSKSPTIRPSASPTERPTVQPTTTVRQPEYYDSSDLIF
jgi:hypothetical protein